MGNAIEATEGKRLLFIRHAALISRAIAARESMDFEVAARDYSKAAKIVRMNDGKVPTVEEDVDEDTNRFRGAYFDSGRIFKPRSKQAAHKSMAYQLAADSGNPSSILCLSPKRAQRRTSNCS